MEEIVRKMAYDKGFEIKRVEIYVGNDKSISE